MRRLALLILLGIASLGALPRSVAAPRGEWLAGDQHVHTTWGHDTCITPQEAWDNTKPDFAARRSCEDPYTWGFAPGERLADAEQRGLDYLVITDHNNVMSLRDPDYIAYDGDLIKIPGYESSLSGHAQMIGANACYGDRGPLRTPIVECTALVKDRTAAGMNRLARSLRAHGGVYQINHPSDYSWRDAYGYQVVPDTVEVWNIGLWAFQKPAPSANDNDFSLTWWDGFLRAGRHVAATGGSDSHWRATSLFQGIGEPTTWVFATARTPAAVLAAMRAGRTTISAEPPQRHGVRAWLEADANGDGTFESMVGDTVPARSPVRVRTDPAVPGALVRVVTDTMSTETTLTGDTLALAVNGRRYVRVELFVPDAQAVRTAACDPVARMLESGTGEEFTACRNRLVMLALTSPIYLR